MSRAVLDAAAPVPRESTPLDAARGDLSRLGSGTMAFVRASASGDGVAVAVELASGQASTERWRGGATVEVEASGAAGGLVATGTGAIDPTGELPARHLAIDGGALYVACADIGVDTQWRIEKRLTSDFSLVASFGAAGLRIINPSIGDDRPLDLLFLGGVLYAAGSDASLDGGRWRIEAVWK